MARWNALYQEPMPLSPDWGHHRIFSPAAYAHVRQLMTVPIVLQDAMVVGRHFPICWQRFGDQLHLVALIALKPGAVALPPYDELPLAIRAYPFVVPKGGVAIPESYRVDRTIADNPLDIGAPILLDDGKFSDAARIRLHFAAEVGAALPTIDGLSEDLEGLELLEPWPLLFDFGPNGKVERRDLFVLAASQLGRPAVFSLVERYGAEVGVFLGLHRASLYRINWLMAAARKSPPAQIAARSPNIGKAP